MMSVKYILFLSIAYFLCSCGGSVPPNFSSNIDVVNKEMISAAENTIHTGDVIMRSGKDFTSYRIRELSDKDKTYSHAGIAYVTDTNVYIYHICPPDLDESKADTIMRFETLEQFVKPSKCFGFGIVRYKLNEDEINKSIVYLDSLKKKKTTFDYLFDLTNSDKMYCSEMIDNTFRYATTGRIKLERKYFTRIQSARAARYFHASIKEVMKREFIPIDNIHINPYCTVIHNYVFLK